MKKLAKKMICLIGITVCILGSVSMVSADTVRFNVTIPDDIYSYAVRKADWEQKFYVTGTAFNTDRTLYCYSQNINDHTVKGGAATISRLDVSDSAVYEKIAVPGELYEMVTAASLSGVNVEGRYTP